MNAFPELMLENPIDILELKDLPLITEEKKHQLEEEIKQSGFLYQKASLTKPGIIRRTMTNNIYSLKNIQQCQNAILDKLVEEEVSPIFEQLPEDIKKDLNIKTTSKKKIKD